MRRNVTLVVYSLITALIIMSLLSLIAFGNDADFPAYALSHNIGPEIKSDVDEIYPSSNSEADVSYSYEHFSDIMGMNGIIQKTESALGNEKFCTRTYYAFGNNCLKKLAYTTDLLRGEGKDFKVDINDDGIYELICNTQSGCGHVYAELFTLQDNQIMHGYIALPEEVIDAYGWWGHEALDVAYNPDSREFDLTYYSQNGEIIAQSTYPLDKASFDLREYEMEEYPLENLSSAAHGNSPIFEQGPFNSVRKEMGFSDVLGFDGYYLDRSIYLNGDWQGDWHERVYYTDGDEGSNIIAYSYGFEEDYYLDIDLDGEKELLCNCESGDGSRKNLRVYKIINGIVNLGVFDINKCERALPDFAGEDYETDFNVSRNVMQVYFPDHFWKTGKSLCGFDFGPECIEYEPWSIDKEYL